MNDSKSKGVMTGENAAERYLFAVYAKLSRINLSCNAATTVKGLRHRDAKKKQIENDNSKQFFVDQAITVAKWYQNVSAAMLEHLNVPPSLVRPFPVST